MTAAEGSQSVLQQRIRALGFVMLYKFCTQSRNNSNNRCIFTKQFCSSCLASFYVISFEIHHLRLCVAISSHAVVVGLALHTVHVINFILASVYAYFAAGYVKVVYFTPEEVYDAMPDRRHSVAVAS